MNTLLLASNILLGLGLLFIGLGGIRLWRRHLRLAASFDRLERELHRYDFYAVSLERTCKLKYEGAASRLMLVEKGVQALDQRLARVKDSL